MIDAARRWARTVKQDIVALYIAGRDPRTPWSAKVVAAAVVAYALSPIDLIPDFIPVIGYLDDILIVPAGILLAVRLIPPALMDEFRTAATAGGRLPSHKLGAALVVGFWTAGTLALLWLMFC